MSEQDRLAEEDSASDSKELRDLAKKINRRERRSRQDQLEHARRQGIDLIRAKELCKHGEWLSWLSENVELSESRCQHYMQFAKTIVTREMTEEEAWAEWQRISGNKTKEQQSEQFEAWQRNRIGKEGYKEPESVGKFRTEKTAKLQRASKMFQTLIGNWDLELLDCLIDEGHVEVVETFDTLKSRLLPKAFTRSNEPFADEVDETPEEEADRRLKRKIDQSINAAFQVETQCWTEHFRAFLFVQACQPLRDCLRDLTGRLETDVQAWLRTQPPPAPPVSKKPKVRYDVKARDKCRRQIESKMEGWETTLMEKANKDWANAWDWLIGLRPIYFDPKELT